MPSDFAENAFKEALNRVNRYYLDALPSEDQIVYNFSEEFLEKMQDLIRQRKSKGNRSFKTWGKRLVIGIAAVLVILMATAMTVPPMREKIVEYTKIIYKQFTHLFFRESKSEYEEEQDFYPLLPQYIPDGFELIAQDLGGIVLLTYEDNEDFLSYIQQRLKDVSMHINTEGIQPEELVFEDFSAIYYSNRGVQNLMWYDEHYVYMVSSTLDRETIFEIAESVPIF